MKKLFPLFLFIFFISCTNRQVFVNKSGSCKLKLHSDSTYYLKYPTFMGNRHENGTYTVTGNSILLKHIVVNTFDSTDWSSVFLLDHPDTVEFSFKNLYDSSICVTFTLNHNSSVFKTDPSGHLKILYSELATKKIISSDSTFHSIDIIFDKKTYHVSDKMLLPKPTAIDITLNQLIDKPEVAVYRHFKYSNDTITVYGFDPKAIGSDRRLIRR